MINYFTDIKYINLISSRLDKFSWKKTNLAQCRCPICGDSQKNKNKTRFYFYQTKTNYAVKCHNCGYAVPFYRFLERIDNNIYNDYRRELFLSKQQENTVFVEEVKIEPPKFKSDALKVCTKLTDLDGSHPCVKYVEERQIPKSKWDLLYYIDDFSVLSYELDKEYKTSKDERLVIPFFTKDLDIMAAQGRALNNDTDLRYVTIKNPAYKDVVRIYGLDRFDESKNGYVVEGPIDSLFLDNCVAIAGSSISYSDLTINLDNATFIFDNEPRNKEIIKSIKSAINHNYKVCIWEDNLPYKDINNMVVAGIDVKSLIETNTYRGLEAELKLSKWRKV